MLSTERGVSAFLARIRSHHQQLTAQAPASGCHKGAAALPHLQGGGAGHGRQPGKTTPRHRRCMSWRGQPGLAVRGGGRRVVFHAIVSGLGPNDRRRHPASAGHDLTARTKPLHRYENCSSGLSTLIKDRLSGGASRLAALLLPQILPVSSVVAPCDPGAARRNPVLVQRGQATRPV